MGNATYLAGVSGGGGGVIKLYEIFSSVASSDRRVGLGSCKDCCT